MINDMEYIKGSLAELNMQMVNLKKRKDQLMKKADEIAVEAGALEQRDYFSGGSYARYLQMMAEKREPVAAPRVVYQGEPGAYSEMACRKFFGSAIRPQGLYDFEDTFLALAEGRADYAVLPIENSSTGAIRQVYDLLEQYHYFFVGETTVKIEHALMALPGTEIEDITHVYSHEQGIFQCEKFLKQYPQWKRIPQADTAGSAKMVAETENPHAAAICSTLAAEIYGLNILREGINANRNNTTRFVVVSPKAEIRREKRDKVCIALTTAHNSGALHNVLTVFAVHGINLVRLESRPIPERRWEYMFFLEFTGDLMTPEIDSVIHEISLMSEDLRVLGNFKSNL